MERDQRGFPGKNTKFFVKRVLWTWLWWWGVVFVSGSPHLGVIIWETVLESSFPVTWSPRFRWYLKRADSKTASNSSLKLMLLFCKYPKRCRYRLNCDMPVILVPLPALLRLWMLRFVMAILVADCVSVWASVGVVEAMCEGDKRRRMKKSVKEYLTERNMVVA